MVALGCIPTVLFIGTTVGFATADSRSGTHSRTPREDGARIESVFPTPTRGPVTFVVWIPREGALRIRVFDICGRYITTAVDSYEIPGSIGFRWNGLSTEGGKLSSGLYVAVLETNNQVALRKFVIAR
jgi:hypothetical protein